MLGELASQAFVIGLLKIVGLAISIPLVILECYPIIITLGAALLGWVAGKMFVTDPLVAASVDTNAPILHWLAPAAGALLVVMARTILGRRAPRLALQW